MKKRFMTFVLSATMALALIPLGNFVNTNAASNANALTPLNYQKGDYTVIASSLNVRSGTGTNYKIITQVKKDSSYSCVENQKVNGVVWYKITVNSSTIGWISSQYCKSL